ncbi:uncharacterized protein LOC143604912 [Bidens hawaiensis]|uniref:uncharacterized protein LOC143604912 n=1 Tax=Bidens hawaiensis TaxID=980011 RepID=UPI004049A821
MEHKKEPTSSLSSLTTDPVGSKESLSSSSSALFDSSFTPLSKAYTRDHISYEQPKKDYDFTPKRDCLDNEDKIQKAKMIDWSAYYDQQVAQPCALSSSLYYGGQDIYIPRTTKNTPGQYSTGGHITKTPQSIRYMAKETDDALKLEKKDSLIEENAMFI